MSKLKNWSFKDLERFLKDYNFKLGHIKGSHYFFNGKIKGKYVVVQVIYSNKERKSQSNKTMSLAVKHSNIPKKYFEEWKLNKIIHREIIY